MKIELLVFAITGFFIMNIYHDGKYTNILKSWEKYYKMTGIAFAGLSAYLFFKKYPSDTHTLLSSASGVIRHLPVDKSVGNLFEPLLKLSKQVYPEPVQDRGTTPRPTKRCVSETKKKYVAARQGWICGRCQIQLPAWFEIDHTTRLEHGGTNHIDNLVALCRNCHGEKTALENL